MTNNVVTNWLKEATAQQLMEVKARYQGIYDNPQHRDHAYIRALVVMIDKRLEEL